MSAKYRNALPQLGDKMFITDGGLETELVFKKQIDLPLFAAFDLLSSGKGQRILRDYFDPYIELAKRHQHGLILDTATWRASTGWGEKLGYSRQEIAALNQRNVEMLEDIRKRHATPETPMVINGAIGPEDDGYNPARRLDADSAEAYHRHQVEEFADSAADMVSAITMTYVDEAIGIARAASKAGIPVAISFTTETDGRLPDGTTLEDAIAAVDAATGQAPVYYMINCAHPTHFAEQLRRGAAWTDRIAGIRANASRLSHAELDEATELDEGDPQDFGNRYAELQAVLKNLRVIGGCCGSDHRHVGEACRAVA